MNLLYTITAYPPSVGGAQIHHHYLASQLKERHNIQVVCHWDENRTDWLLGTTVRAPRENLDYVYDNIPVHRLGLSHKEKLQMILPTLSYYFFMGKAARSIAQIIEKKITPYSSRANLIHNVRIGREPLSLASYITAKKMKIPFILTPVHHPRWKGWRYQTYNWLYRQADALIALTQVEKRTLMSLGIAEERIFVTGIGPVLAEQNQPDDFLKVNRIDGPAVLFLGQHYDYKGYQQILQASPLVWEHFPNTHFIFIGPSVGKSEDIFRNDQDYRIHRLGKVDLQTKTDALSACDMLCVPSTQESFGGVYLEAWNFSRPVIGCAIPAVTEVVSHGNDGLLVEQEPNSIAQSILYLLKNPQKSDEMGKAGFHKVENQYNWNLLGKKTEEIYQTLLSNKKLLSLDVKPSPRILSH